MGASSLDLPATHQINFKQIVTDTANWVELKQSFIADSAYEFITIGNLNPYDSTKIDTILMPIMVGSDPNAFAYYFIDDVSLVEDTTSGFVNENGSNYKLIIYPNPCNDKLLVMSDKLSVNTIEVNDILGRVCIIPPLQGGKGDFSIDISTLPKGIYFIKATDTFGNSLIGKFVKE